MSRKKIFIGILTIILTMTLTISAQAKSKSLMMATTTSTDNTGLLDYLIPHFEKETGISLKWTATGTGKALKLGQNCDVDVLLVHAPPAEKKYIENGYGKDRRSITERNGSRDLGWWEIHYGSPQTTSLQVRRNS